MAPTQAAVAVPSVSFDVQLARRAAVLIGYLRPRQKLERAVADLLERLQRERQQREARGLNHWDAHAPRFLGSLVRQARVEKQKRHQEAEAFYKAKRREALRFAQVIVGDSAAAEAVTAETYRELLEGGTTSNLFFSALVGNARNYVEGRAKRNDTFQPFEAAGEGEGDDVARFVHEPASHHLEDQDPLDILIAREEAQERAELIARAKKDPRWRYIKTRDWAAPLRECAESAGSPE